MTALAEQLPAAARGAEAPQSAARIALLGLGRVGGALATRVERDSACLGRPVALTGALVRDPGKHAGRIAAPLVREARPLLEPRPDVLVEALGGLEPARTILLDALERGIPVVTANKSVLAAHGDELGAAADRSATPLRCEAAVLAGVPFLGTLARRPLASRASRLVGVLNGTSNFILSRVAAGIAPDDALREAQRLGLAEPDAANDLDGIDAAEKLVVLLRQLAGLSIEVRAVPTTSVRDIAPPDLEHAGELGGTIKPVVFAEWSGTAVVCGCGPAFVRTGDALARLAGVHNGIRIEGRDGLFLYYEGPGAGPDVTARTILDDVNEVLAGSRTGGLRAAARRGRVERWSGAGWYVRLQSNRPLPEPVECADLLGAHGLWVQRWASLDTRAGSFEQALLTFPCRADHLDAALEALGAAAGCDAAAFPIVGADHA